MKTVEEKAKAYDEAIDKARVYVETDKDNTMQVYARGTMEYLFPELEESEDEKIIIFIKQQLAMNCRNSTGKEDEELVTKYNSAIAWLEKQGEQKHIEEINGDNYGIDGLWHAVNILESTLGKVEGYQTDDGILEHKAAITAVKKLKEQKTAEWSDEDWNNIETIATHLDNLNNQAMATVLRNLRDKMFWKPTSAQLDSLFISKNIVRKEHFEKMSDDLDSLYDELKKLK